MWKTRWCLSAASQNGVDNVRYVHEWYTSQWLMAAAKERQPQQMTSFASMHL